MDFFKEWIKLQSKHIPGGTLMFWCALYRMAIYLNLLSLDSVYWPGPRDNLKKIFFFVPSLTKQNLLSSLLNQMYHYLKWIQGFIWFIRMSIIHHCKWLRGQSQQTFSICNWREEERKEGGRGGRKLSTYMYIHSARDICHLVTFPLEALLNFSCRLN